MAFLAMLGGVGLWVRIGLRGRPLVPYLAIFFTTALLAAAAEVTALRLLHVYEWRMQRFADRAADTMLASIVVGTLNPLMAVLYARYCRPKPVLKALLAATLLGLTEILMVKTGYIVYRFWSPLLSAGIYWAYFLVVWRISLRMTRIPLWLHLWGFVVWIIMNADIPLQGIGWFWHFNVTLFGEVVRDNRLASMAQNGILPVACALAVSLANGRFRWLWAALALCLLVLIEAAELRAGLLVYDRWSLAWSAVKYAGIIAASAVYARWVQNYSRRAPG